MKRSFSQLGYHGEELPPNDNSISNSRKRVRVDPGLFVAAPIPHQIPDNSQTGDPGAELCLRRIPDDAAELDIRQTIEDIFHTLVYTQYAGGVPFNFHLQFTVSFSLDGVAMLSTEQCLLS